MGKRILVVDDEEMIRTTVSRCLTRKGHTVICAGNGVEGLARARETEVDLILSDVLMPELSGVAMTRRLREAGVTVPIVLMSGHTGSLESEVSAMLNSGIVSRLLEKPFDFMGELVPLVESF